MCLMLYASLAAHQFPTIRRILELPYIAPGERRKMARLKLIASILMTLLAPCVLAQEHQHRNGEKLGEVHFATSCNAPAQKEFNRAVALLHSFQFSNAI